MQQEASSLITLKRATLPVPGEAWKSLSRGSPSLPASLVPRDPAGLSFLLCPEEAGSPAGKGQQIDGEGIWAEAWTCTDVQIPRSWEAVL